MKHFALSLSLLALIAFSSCNKESLVDTSSNQLVDITSQAQFDEGIADGVSMIFFHASWCSKCKEQRPAVEEVSVDQTYKGVFFAEVEYDDHSDLVKAQKIDGFPTVVIYKDGVEQKKFAGKGHTRGQFEGALDAALK